MILQKYIYAFKINIIAAFQYRFNTLSNIIVWNISIIPLIVFYAAAFVNRDVINNYTLLDMVSYILIIKVIVLFTFHSVCYELANSIKTGLLSQKLILPQNYFLQLWFRALGEKIIELSCGVLLLLILSFFIHITIVGSLESALYFVISILIGAIISFQIGITIGLFAFWFEEIFSLTWSLMVIINLFSGQVIPLDFFPDHIRIILEHLPTAAIGYFPTKIMIGHYSTIEIFQYLTIYLGWIFLLSLIILFTWRNGLKKYSAVGA